MFLRSVCVVILGLATTAAAAAVPEGLGGVSLGLGIQPGQQLGYGGNTPTTVDYESQTGAQEHLAADVPVWSGLSAALGAGFQQSPSSAYSNTPGGSPSSVAITDQIQLYDFSVRVAAYPAAFAGLGFRPGRNANPDGWLGWPSVALGYDAAKSNEIISYLGVNSFSLPPGASLYVFGQDLDYGLTLPVAPWATVRAGYHRNIEEDVSYSFQNQPAQASDAAEGESAELDFYVNLVPGAGRNEAKAFVPHLGRLGQLRIGLGWDRDIHLFHDANTYSYVTGQQRYSLGVGAPVTASLGLQFGWSEIQRDAYDGLVGTLLSSVQLQNRDSTLCSVAASWAFGSPESRVDR